MVNGNGWTENMIRLYKSYLWYVLLIKFTKRKRTEIFFADKTMNCVEMKLKKSSMTSCENCCNWVKFYNECFLLRKVSSKCNCGRKSYEKQSEGMSNIFIYRFLCAIYKIQLIYNRLNQNVLGIIEGNFISGQLWSNFMKLIQTHSRRDFESSISKFKLKDRQPFITIKNVSVTPLTVNLWISLWNIEYHISTKW